MSIASEISRLNTAKADIKAVLEGKGIPVSSTLKIDGYAQLIESIVPDTRVVAKFNVTDTSSPTQICNSGAVSQFSEIEIDGVVQPSVVSEYTFSTVGEHTVKYILTDTTTIGNSVFFECSGLTSVIIPNSVTSIGNNAFSRCSSLTSVTIPNSVTSIGNYVFIRCSNLTSVTIGNSVTSIGSGTFEDCSGLTSVSIPNSVTSIGNSAFNRCTGLTSVHITDVEVWCNISFENFNSNPLYYAHHLYINGSEITDLVIPNSVTSIGLAAFVGCSGLTSVTIPASVTSIGQSAFSGCSGLISVAIPNSVTSIGNSAFNRCTGLTSITIPSSVTSIESNAFRNCSGLTAITSLAMTAPTISSNTFRDVKTGGTLTVPTGSTGYDTWMGTGNYYLGKYGWTKVEQ